MDVFRNFSKAQERDAERVRAWARDFHLAERLCARLGRKERALLKRLGDVEYVYEAARSCRAED